MRSGVEVSLRDERDPHRGWLIGSREGRRLVSALVEALGTASREGNARGLDD
jgi:hypothetical protein